MRKEIQFHPALLLCVFLCFSIAAAFLVTDGFTHPHDTIFRVSDGAFTSLPAIIDDLKRAKILFVGELHDQKAHHEAQLQIIRILQESGFPVAVGLEMFQAENQPALDKWTSGEMGEKDFVKMYYNNWRMPWPLYRDIFLYSREKGIPLIGLNVAPEIVAQVAEKGFKSLTKEQLQNLPGASCNINPKYQQFIRKVLGMHGEKKSFLHFCEAQMVWDTTMAWNVLQFIDKKPQYTVVVLAGGGHAWKLGIPEQVRRQSEHSFKVILPELSARGNLKNVTVDEADYLWLGI